jgi:hypothetical protein
MRTRFVKYSNQPSATMTTRATLATVQLDAASGARAELAYSVQYTTHKPWAGSRLACLDLDATSCCKLCEQAQQ